MDIQEILRNIPPGIYSLVCGTAGLLLIAFSVILYRRMKRNEQPAASNGVPASASGPGISTAIKNFFFYSEEEKQSKPDAFPSQTPERSAPPPVTHTPAPAGPPGAAEILRVWRDVADGSLIIQIDGETYRAMPEIIAAGQDKRFMHALRELARMAKETSATPPPAPKPEPAPTAVEPEPVADPAPAAGKAHEQKAERQPAPQRQAPAKNPAGPPVVDQAATPLPPVSRPSTFEDELEAEPIGSFFDNVKKVVSKRGKQDDVPVPEVILSIPEQIEEHLQRKLASKPDWRSRSIHIRAAHDGGVRIEVDGKFYEGVTDIEEADVREFVMAAIQDWEAQG